MKKSSVSSLVWIGSVVLTIGAVLAAQYLREPSVPPVVAAAAPDTVVVYKSPTCGCCLKWVEHLQQAGFTVETHDEPQMSLVKTRLGVPEALGSCHTATVNGYVIEGHVPAEDIRQLLAKRPKAKGLAVPGMPIGSPGMEMGDRVDPYQTLLFDGQGRSSVFSRHGTASAAPVKASSINPQPPS
ncbi:DUF411 domain-containing protein [Stagnimonas aquatica]|uniref:DUF411 domain-containing protein n=1 Tax=Stagnimonas aquatica TaxID=2689987 RepID=UPI001F38B2B1|nr:DUF411 domain-containing protein [Stagnimonas aquatica]